MKRTLYAAITLLLLPAVLFSQQSVTGRVLDAANNQPMLGATVMIEGTTTGTITDADGRFTIALEPGQSVILVSYIGYSRERIDLSGKTDVTILIKEETRQIEEVMVTALGIRSEKKALGYSAQEVKSDEVNTVQQSSFINALSSKVAGVNVTSSSGTPGASSDIVIRGRTSLRADKNAPLFIVDGVPIDNSYAGSYVYDYSNRAIDLNPEDIESVSVLKGAAASALYGIRAANGAILITTKSGKGRGKDRGDITFKTSFGFDIVNKLPEKQGRYSQGTNGNYSSTSNFSWGALIDTLRYDGALNNPKDRNGNIVGMSDPAATDKRVVPYDNLGKFFETGLTNDTYLSMSNGNDQGNYFFSAGNTFQQGIVPKTDMKRASVKLAGETKVTEKIKVSGTTNFTNTRTNHAQRGSNLSAVMVGLLRCTPTFDLSNGSDDPANDPSAYMYPDGTQRNYYSLYDNPYWSVNKNRSKSEVNRLIANSQAEAELFPWLTATYRLGIDYYTETRNSFFDNNSSDTPNGYVTLSTYNFSGINSDLLLTAKKDITEDLKLTATAGHNFYTTHTYLNSQRGDSLVLPNFYDISNTSVTSGSDYITDYGTASVFYDISIAYRNFFYLNTTGRKDWTSTLAKENNSFFYPSVSTSIIFSELLGLESGSKFSFGKLRLSYAEVGNDADVYLLENYYTAITGGINGQTSFATQRTIGNRDLEPEKTISYEGGLDIRFFNNRAGLDFSIYKSQSVGQIVEVPVTYSTGYDHMVMNAGTITNKGIEAILNLTPIESDNFGWRVSVNFTRNRNMVEVLPEGVPVLDFETTGVSSTRSLAIEKQAYGVLFGSRYLRNEDGKVLVDDNGYPLVDAIAGVIGDPNHDYTMGISTNFTFFKNLSLYALFEVKQGGVLFNGTRNVMNYMGTSKQTENREEDYIFPGINVNTGLPNDVPVKRDFLYYSKQGTLAGLSEAGIEDASLIRLREVSLRYSLPSEFLSKTFIKRAELGVSGRNLWLRTKYSGIDPETNLSGTSNSLGRDYFNMPNTMGATIDLRVSF